MTTLISQKEAGRLLGVHPKTIQTYIKKGWIKAQRLPGGYRKVLADSLQPFLKKSQPEPTACELEA